MQIDINLIIYANRYSLLHYWCLCMSVFLFHFQNYRMDFNEVGIKRAK